MAVYAVTNDTLIAGKIRLSDESQARRWAAVDRTCVDAKNHESARALLIRYRGAGNTYPELFRFVDRQGVPVLQLVTD